MPKPSAPDPWTARVAALQRDHLRAPPRLTVSEWADAARRLSPEASAEPGAWRTDRAAYQRAIMDAVTDPRIHTVVAMVASQTGKTEVLLNVIGYHMQHDPAPTLLLQPTLEMAEAFSKDRLVPMLRDTPSLRGLVKEARSRDSGNTLLHKTFPAGHITLAGANSAASLASRPIRIVLCDEVDRFPASAGTEGDPVTLAKQRSATFWRRKLILVSTPTIKGASRIAAAYEASDQRHYLVPCPACGTRQALDWAHVRWPKDRPEAAAYVCFAHCGAEWGDGLRLTAVLRGSWEARAPFSGTAGFWLSGLYSPWTRLGELAREFVEAAPHAERLKAFTNLKLAELWEGDGEAPTTAEELRARAEDYPQWTVPPGACLLTAGVDVQDDRLAVAVWAWGRGETAWCIGWTELLGDPVTDEPWKALDDLLGRRWPHENGGTLTVAMTAVDTGGHRTQAVYSYARQRTRTAMAVKGASRPGQPVIATRPSLVDVHFNGRKVPNGAQLWTVGTDTAKAELYARLALADGPRSVHFAADLPLDFYAQLTAERRVTRYHRGVARQEWVLPSGARNEAEDALVYAYAAALRLGLARADWDRLEAAVAAPETATPPAATEVTSPWVSAW
jgi:phage terminase large subunit GpA-like protein